MFVSDILKSKGSKVVSVPSGARTSDAVVLLVEHRIGAVLVLGRDGRVAGILSERDLVQAMHEHGPAVFDRKVDELMTAEVVTCTPQDPIASLMGMMTAQRFRHVPVVSDEGKLVGIVSIGDVLKSHMEETEFEAEALRRYITT